MTNATIDTRPDYEVAREELGTLFASLALTVSISEPRGDVHENDWPCIAYSVTIGSETFPYALGIGHVDWKKAARNPSASRLFGNDVRAVELVAAGRTLVDRSITAYLAARIAKDQKVQPSAADVLASVCREGMDADQSFENWCGDFGYDTDSRKAEDIYRACTENGKKARRILGAENYRKFAELSARL